MKLNSAEVGIARLTLATLEAKLLDLVEHERFDEILKAIRDTQTAKAIVVELVSNAANLARLELGLPPAKTADEPGVQ